MELKCACSWPPWAQHTVQIVPLWNWNSGRTISPRRRHLVQIVPLWNWNKIIWVASVRFASSNCTFMELKWEGIDKFTGECYVQIVPLWNWNFQHLVWQSRTVQIVPLWNWNIWSSISYTIVISSNCTFMELKFVIVAWSLLVEMGSNCTFMELKFDRRQRNERSHRVLIVPLWNWNIDNMYWVNSEQSSNLIVPLWN